MEDPEYNNGAGTGTRNQNQTQQADTSQPRANVNVSPSQAGQQNTNPTPVKGGLFKKKQGEPNMIQCILGELLGTFLLVFIGCASCQGFGIVGLQSKITQKPPDANSATSNSSDSSTSNSEVNVLLHPYVHHFMIAFTFGISVATIAQAIGHVSGCHLNTAVTLGLLAAGECPLIKSMIYIVVQLLGAILAGLLLVVFNHTKGTIIDAKDNLTYESNYCVSSVSDYAHPGTVIAAIVNELIITFLLVLTVLGACDSLRKDVKGSAPLAIGLAVFLGHIMGIRYSGASMNPARSLGPLIVGIAVNYKAVHGAVLSSYIYVLGPIGGGVLAGIMYKLIFKIKPAED